jgi:integrase
MGIYRRKDSSYWWFLFVRKGLRITGSTEVTDKKLAQAIYEKKLGDFVGAKEGVRPPTTTLKELIGAWTDYAKANKRSWEDDVSHCRVALEFFGNIKASEITQQRVEQFRAHRKAFVGEATINRACAILKAMFNAGVRWGLVRGNPFVGIKFYNESERARTRYLSESERRRLIEACRPDLKAFVIMALKTGLRQAELMRLRWTDVDFSANIFKVATSKSGKPRFLPLHPDVVEVLNKQPKASPYVFPTDDDRQSWSYFRKAWDKAIRQAGIENFRFHDCRHDFGSQLAMKGVDLLTISRLLGHGSITMTQRYAHLSPNHQKIAIGLLSSEKYYAGTTLEKEPSKSGSTEVLDSSEKLQ